MLSLVELASSSSATVSPTVKLSIPSDELLNLALFAPRF